MSNRNLTSDDIITLDVGGKLFKVLRSTLIGQKESLFAKMFDPDNPYFTASPTKTEEGTYFIDADPEVFPILLDCFISGGEYFPREGVSNKRVEMAAKNFDIDIKIPKPKRLIVVRLQCHDRHKELKYEYLCELTTRSFLTWTFDHTSMQQISSWLASDLEHNYRDNFGFEMDPGCFTRWIYDDLPDEIVLMRMPRDYEHSHTHEEQRKDIQDKLSFIADNFDRIFALH